MKRRKKPAREEIKLDSAALPDLEGRALEVYWHGQRVVKCVGRVNARTVRVRFPHYAPEKGVRRVDVSQIVNVVYRGRAYSPVEWRERCARLQAVDAS